MLNVPKEILHVFVNGDSRSGMIALCQKEASDALKALISANPMDAVAIAKAQDRHHLFTKDLPSIWRQIDEFAAQQAAAAGQQADKNS